MHNIDWSFLLLHASTLLLLGLFVLILLMKNKKEIHFFSLSLVLFVFIWSFAMLLETYATNYYEYSGMLFTNIYFTAVNFVPVCIFFIGLTFAYSATALTKRFYPLFLVPVLSTILLWTNKFHQLFFVSYSLQSNEIIKGPFLIGETFFAYACNLIGLYFLLYFSIKNSGFFSRQSFLIVVGASVPLSIDMAFASGLFSFPLYYEAISFSFAALFFMLAIFRFDFLNVVPIALQTIVDHISDSYIVINEDLEVIDYNKPLTDIFDGFVGIKRKQDIKVWLDQINALSTDETNSFIISLNKAISTRTSVSFDKQLCWDGFDKTFAVEITPLSFNGKNKGTIILLKDITDERKSFELIRQAQAQLIKNEHLASLGQLVGGIAHNLRTPIMSISGGLEGLSDLISEYDQSIEEKSVSHEDHHEIAKEMRQWIEKMKHYASYMSDVISTVKGQAVQLTSGTTDKFILRELLKRIDILMNHELKRFSCKLNLKNDMDEMSEIKGEINSFIQVINNLITNAIEAYAGESGEIDFTITQKDNMIQFEIRDYASGMSTDVKNKLFKEMITTKGQKGTGLGLYMSYSMIVGRFGGKMWFDSEEGTGTVFFVLVPIIMNHEKLEAIL